MTWIDPDDTPSNPHAATATTLPDLIAATVNRRTVLAGGVATAALTFFSGLGTAAARPATPANARAQGAGASRTGTLLGFEPLPTGQVPPFDGTLVAHGYSLQYLAPWGDPVNGVSPAYVDDGGNTAEEQALQLGMGHDGMEYFPIDGSSEHGLLAINHEYTVTTQLFPADWYDEVVQPDGSVRYVVNEEYLAAASRKEQQAHGIAVVEVQKGADGRWQVVDGGLGRRVTTYTEMDISGPAAGHELLHWGDRDGTTTDGTANNCSSGRTPWGTYVTCEENFNGYFWVGEDGTGTAPDGHEELFARYGISGKGFDYVWGGVDERWRADLNPGRTNTYGWNVELDPFDPDSRPVKRTAMGRIKHEGATFTEGRGRKVVCYMGDDERFDYLYKYVSHDNWRAMFARKQHPLDHGTLYVAKFHEDGTGDWLALDHDNQPALQEDPRFADQAEVLIKTRIAADVLGATPCDRPEWTAVHPRTGEVFVTMTNNTRRTAPDPANPIVGADDTGFDDSDSNNRPDGNENGHIVSIREAGGDNAATSFAWDVFLAGGDGTVPQPADGASHHDIPFVGRDAAFGSPDGLAFDRDGRLWIQTDGGQPYGMNDQMLAADPSSREVKRFLMGPKDCEVTGLTFTPDGRTAFINIQHPNDGVPPTNKDVDQSVYPPDTSYNRPRPSTIVITKDDGGVIGS